jgi:hypothetical protein
VTAVANSADNHGLIYSGTVSRVYVLKYVRVCVCVCVREGEGCPDMLEVQRNSVCRGPASKGTRSSFWETETASSAKNYSPTILFTRHGPAENEKNGGGGIYRHMDSKVVSQAS